MIGLGGSEITAPVIRAVVSATMLHLFVTLDKNLACAITAPFGAALVGTFGLLNIVIESATQFIDKFITQMEARFI